MAPSSSLLLGQAAQLSPPIDNGDQVDFILPGIILVQQQIAALDQHPRAPPDVIAQSADPRELPQDLHPLVDPQNYSVSRRWIVCRNVAPDFAQIRLRAEGDKEFSHAGAWEIAIKSGLGKLELPQTPQDYLEKHLRMNRVSNATLFKVAVSDASGEARFRQESSHSMGRIDASNYETFKACWFGVILCPIVISWPYVIENYFRAAGDRWGRRG